MSTVGYLVGDEDGDRSNAIILYLHLHSCCIIAYMNEAILWGKNKGVHLLLSYF